MPRFYFHVRHSEGCDEVLDGTHFEGIEEAKVDAMRCLREIVADNLRAAQPVDIAAMDIIDQRGVILATVSIDEAVLKPLVGRGEG